jgi:hypothetical protein
LKESESTTTGNGLLIGFATGREKGISIARHSLSCLVVRVVLDARRCLYRSASTKSLKAAEEWDGWIVEMIGGQRQRPCAEHAHQPAALQIPFELSS